MCVECDDKLYAKLGGLPPANTIEIPVYGYEFECDDVSVEDKVEIFTIFKNTIGFVPDIDRNRIKGKLAVPDGYTGIPEYNMVIFLGESVPDVLFKYMKTYVNALEDIHDDIVVSNIIDMASTCPLSDYLLSVLIKIRDSLINNCTSDDLCVSYHESQAS